MPPRSLEIGVAPYGNGHQTRAFLIEHGIAVRAGANAPRNSMFEILKSCADEISAK